MKKGDKMLDRYKMSIQLVSLSSTSSSALYFFCDNKCGRNQGKGKGTSTRDAAPRREDKEEEAQQGLKKLFPSRG